MSEPGINRIFLIEAYDSDLVKPEWYESEEDARNAAPEVTGIGAVWEIFWRISAFTREVNR